jgi:hypothetical protein
MEERGLLCGWARRCAGAAMLLALAIGCRTPPPILKPPPAPEELNKPPMEARYDNPEWPKVCTDDPNPKKAGAGKDESAFSKNGMGGVNPGGMATGSGGGPR